MTKTPADILGDAGPVAAKLREQLGAKAYESRPEQIRMAEAVARTLEKRDRLLVEAGTGVGKSFAYLVPAMLRAMQKGEKIVIATATIALQEQLIGKDIPLLMEAMRGSDGVTERRSDEGKGGGEPSPGGFEIVPVLAKGRGNYVSIRRLAVASQRQDSMLPDAEARVSLHVIEDWAKETLDGSLSTLPALNRPEVWDFVRSDTDNCMGRKCAHYKKCFYQNARKELEKANIIVCNHALFFSDLALRVAGGNGAGAAAAGVKAILPNYDHVIFDEAHNIEDAACEHFGLSLSMPRVLRLLRTLFSPRRRKGYLLDRALVLADTNLVDRAITNVQMCDRACMEFFEELLAVWQKNRAGGGRMRVANAVENTLTPAMRELAVCLRRIREGIEAEGERMELASFAKRASEIADVAEALVGQTLGDAYAYWVEVEGAVPDARHEGTKASRHGGEDEDDGDEVGHLSLSGGRGRRGPRVTIACAPIEVAALLKKYLFDPEAAVVEAEIEEAAREDEGFEPLNVDFDAMASVPQPASKSVEPKKIGIVLTSATLATRAIGEDEHPERAETAFAHVMGNLGVTKATTVQLGSPFDYSKQARVIVDLSVPDPKSSGARGARGEDDDQPSYAELLSRRIQHHVRETRGGAFVLFTSFATMNQCADRLKASLSRHGHDLFVQGRDGSRQMVLKRFLEADDAVLFGAASFWQGVDVRGERLRNVIITRLPFEPPDRPLVQARNERIEIGGGNPFMQDSLPRAIIRFKQGFGRLIRSKSDRGRVVVLDPRIRTARYGRMFLQALPSGVRVEDAAIEDHYDF